MGGFYVALCAANLTEDLVTTRLFRLQDGQDIPGWIMKPGDIGSHLMREATQYAFFILGHASIALKVHTAPLQFLDGLLVLRPGNLICEGLDLREAALRTFVATKANGLVRRGRVA